MIPFCFDHRVTHFQLFFNLKENNITLEHLASLTKVWNYILYVIRNTFRTFVFALRLFLARFNALSVLNGKCHSRAQLYIVYLFHVALSGYGDTVLYTYRYLSHFILFIVARM